MLYAGYLGEIKTLERMTASMIGFVALLITFATLFVQYVLSKYSSDNYILFGMYAIIWSIYGVAYHFEEEQKNTTFNYLDLTSKCLVGIGLWIYYVKIIRTV